MEPDTIPLHLSSPPLLDCDGDEGVGSEEDEFGDFSVGISCSPLGLPVAPEPPSCFKQPPPIIKPETHQPNSSFYHPVEESQHTSTVKLESSRGPADVESHNCNAESSLYLTNGFAQDPHKSGGASVRGACSSKEEMGFADFTVFTEQVSHPWCCGLTEQWDRKVGSADLNAGRDVIMESEPRFHHVSKVKEDVCIMAKHCEKRDAALVQPPQDHHQPQEAAAALNLATGEDDPGIPRDGRGERRLSCSSLQSSEVQRVAENICETMYESASDDLASFCDDLSFEGASADLEPNVSSLGSQDDQTDCDRTDDEEEELKNYRRRECLFHISMANLNSSESEKDFQQCNHYATQETSATSSQSQSGTNPEEKLADFSDRSLMHHRDQGFVQTADAGVHILGNLPPSDSFADFCSAPAQDDGAGLWADFKDPSAQVEGTTWMGFREPVSSLQADGDDDEEELRRGEKLGARRKNSCQASLSCRVEQLFQSSFPEVVPAAKVQEEQLVPSALLQTQHLPQSEDVIPELSHALRIQQTMLWLHQDIHSSFGLQFRWGGSHSNRTLLRCLGVDERNIVFVGTKKQPATVPAYASSLGMLEPTKDSVPAVCSRGHTAVAAPPGPRDKSDTSNQSVQENLPSSQLDWRSRGLSSSQDGTSPRRTPHFWGRK
ncbi:uncharacterized protein aftphb isoform 1-T3 [Odontesthes bonariensis]|uniref:uncharacterized protein aftphb n=1 Tax=Odontesthes bonariensis TaxID=219752 RepID=UPI003F5833EA